MSDLILEKKTLASLLQQSCANLDNEKQRLAACEADYASGKDNYAFHMGRAKTIEGHMGEVRGEIRAYRRCLSILEGRTYAAGGAE